MWPVLCSSSSDEESAQQSHIEASENLTLNLTPHRSFGVGSISPAVFIPFATPCLSLRSDLDKPAKQQTHWDHQPWREARTGRRRGPRRPRSEARQGQHRSGRGAGTAVDRDRAVKRRGNRPVGPRWQSTMKPRERPRAAKGKRERERDRRRKNRGKQSMIHGYETQETRRAQTRRDETRRCAVSREANKL